MKYYIQSNAFKTKQCSFSLHYMEAYSYRWWQFVGMAGNTVYFNDASYSMQTSVHQGLVKAVLNKLKIKYKTVYVKAGLQAIPMEISNTRHEIQKLWQAITKPRSHAKTNKWRKQQITLLTKKIQKLQTLQRSFEKGHNAKPHSPQTLKALQKLIEAQREEQREARKPIILNLNAGTRILIPIPRTHKTQSRFDWYDAREAKSRIGIILRAASKEESKKPNAYWILFPNEEMTRELLHLGKRSTRKI